MNKVTQDLTPGTVIQDTYQITKLLGEGGMGATFSGRNLATDHGVAIKVISSSFAENNRAVDLFKREANLLRTIQHDAIVRYETTLQDRNGRLYLVMELLEGQSLSAYIEKGARLGSDDVLKLGRRLAGGLDAIAAVGAVHRDVAPDNIFVPDGNIQSAKLIDFGLASNTVGTEKSILGSDFAGKFSYSAPEQLGYFNGKIGAQTDAYALGLVLMKIAGLDVPGEGLGMGAGPARKDDLVVPAGKVSPALKTVLSELLQADPSKRPSPITPLFERALAQVGQSTSRSEKTQAAVSGAQQKAKGKSGGLWAAAVVVLLVAAGAGGYYVWSKEDALTKDGASIEQGEVGMNALEASDPLSMISELIDQGDTNSLNAAFGAYLEFGGDESQDTGDRIKAYMSAAAMADPEMFNAARSPFESPNPSVARSAYRKAADLGSAEAAQALSRLEE